MKTVNERKECLGIRGKHITLKRGGDDGKVKGTSSSTVCDHFHVSERGFRELE